MSYQLAFDPNAPTSLDKVFDHGDVSIITDAKSHLFLDGATLDYSGGLQGKGFFVVNPSVKRTCGCGESFSC